jgi:hypothetical protein
VVDLFFELIDLLIVGNGDRARFIVALQQSSDGAVEAALGETRHEENVVAQGTERVVERGEDVIRFCHRLL